MNLPGIFVSRRSADTLIQDQDRGDILVINYVDFAHVFPQLSAVIHHGGIGTTAQAIKAGVPQIIRPIMYDQPDNAWRVTKLGLGGVVFPDSYKARKVAEILETLMVQELFIERRKYYRNKVSSKMA